ncbi:hypothetical protein [Legionella clemsonensis]|uniref:Uncharacterized protein n=1 Tax=Legionella clemsonensis TaxID=1867846 RepID=A0A222P5N3_9GAMM|nr:hypothetical protein [Legionella clemsonensis]ASQ47142.1 hypothetical protein clem_13045 [Legionella clemsonensis]
MTVDLLENYIHRLNLLINQENNKELVSLTKELLEQLRCITSISNLQKALNRFSASIGTYSTSQVARQISKWENELQELQLLEKAVLDKFPALTFREEVQSFKRVLEKIFAREDYLFHARAKSLLSYLNDEALQVTLDYLNDLSTGVTSASAILGTFDQSPSLSRKHTACKYLLTKNSINFNEKNSKQVLANNILQSALLIYQDMQSEPKQEVKQSSPCILI